MIVGKYFKVDIFFDSPVDKMSIEQSNVLSLDEDSLPFVLLLINGSIFDILFLDVIGKLLVLASNN